MTTLDTRADALIDATDTMMKALVALRGTRGLTVEEVAERMGVSAATVAAFEAYDANPTQSVIRRYAMAVGARVAIIVTDDNEAAPVVTVPLRTAQDEVEYRVRTSLARVIAAHRHGEDYPRTFVEAQIRDGKRHLEAHGGHTA